MGKVTVEVVAQPVAAYNAKKGAPAKKKVSGRKRSRSSRPKRGLFRGKNRGKKMEAAMRSLRNRVLLAPPP